jgi:hypothetical protein
MRISVAPILGPIFWFAARLSMESPSLFHGNPWAFGDALAFVIGLLGVAGLILGPLTGKA